jgi:sulfonate transport system permease protein
MAVASVWSLYAWLLAEPALFPTIPAVLSALYRWAASGQLIDDVLYSVPRAVLAILVAIPVGTGIGAAFGLSKTFRYLFEGTAHFLRSLPPVALLPVFVLWFGISWVDKLAASAFVSIFPLIVTSFHGAEKANHTYSELKTDFSLSQAKYVARIIVPAMIPSLIPGIRIASGTSFVMLFVSELGGASRGLGYRLSVAQLAYQADLMIAALIVLGLCAFAVDKIVELVGRRVENYGG